MHPKIIQLAQYGLENTAEAAGFGKKPTELATVIGRVISAALLVVGVVFLILTVYAGYLWMISRGNEEMVRKAKDTLISSVIGIVIVVAAYAITAFVIQNIVGK